MELQKIKQAIIDNKMGPRKIFLVTADSGILFYPIAIVGSEIIVLQERGLPYELNATYNILDGFDFIKHIDNYLIDRRYTTLEMCGYMMGDFFETDDGPAFYLDKMI